MLEVYSFVDYFTIPPSFVSIYLDRTWIGKIHFDKCWIWSFWFRTTVPESFATDDCSGHPAVSQHPQDVHFHKVSIQSSANWRLVKWMGAERSLKAICNMRGKSDKNGERPALHLNVQEASVFRATSIVWRQQSWVEDCLHNTNQDLMEILTSGLLSSSQSSSLYGSQLRASFTWWAFLLFTLYPPKYVKLHY